MVDAKFLLIYHSRMLFTHLPTPLLLNAQTPSVISVLLTGREVLIDLQNLELKREYSTSRCLVYGVTMTTLDFHELAKKEGGKRIRFVHLNPGIVKTGVARHLPWYIRAGSKVGYEILRPWRMEVGECGERVWGMGLGDWDGKEEGISGQQGGYALDKMGQKVKMGEVVEKMVGDRYGGKVWKDTMRFFTELGDEKE